MKDKESLVSILDDVADDLKSLSQAFRRRQTTLEEHMTLVRKVEKDLKVAEQESSSDHPEPEIDPNIELVNDKRLNQSSSD